VIRAGKVASRQPDHIVYNSFVSQAQHETFGYHAAYSLVIPNGFDTTLWQPNAATRHLRRAELGLRHGDKLVGFVGRYHPMKDIPNFLQAMARLMATDPHVHCSIIGEDAGFENPALAPYFKALPEARRHVFGPRDDVAQMMQGFDLLCLSSKWGEAFPNVIGEAMACGVPCVATDVGDCRHIVGDTGRIVATSDPIALSRAAGDMLLLDETARLSLGVKARARIDKHFSLSTTVDRYTTLYNSILKGH
jgi:glycosyltransferase involved in cell wall biosynthesis